jgi:adenine phosphoribosyltransferase
VHILEKSISDLKKFIRDFPDFPKPGIIFKDITNLIKNPEYFNIALSQIENSIRDIEFDFIISPESRGFIFGAPIAYKMNKGFIPARKKGKLPGEVASKSYSLEYGSEIIEIHKDSIKSSQKAIIIDDLLATGGTVKSIIDIIQELGAEIIYIIFLIELKELKGRENLKGYNIDSILKY